MSYIVGRAPAGPPTGHGRGTAPRLLASLPTSALPFVPPAVPGAAAVAAVTLTGSTASTAVSPAAVSATKRMPGGASLPAGWGRGGMMTATAGAWRSAAHGSGANSDSTNGNGHVYGSWDVRRAVGATAATAAAAAALDANGAEGFGSGGGGGGGGIAGVGGGKGGGEGTAFLERPTAEVRMSMVSERAAATCALGPEVAERMQADCIRAVRSWCKLGYGDHIVVHVEHQQLASATNPGLLSAAATIFNAPDGRRHSAIAVSVGILCAPAAAAEAAATTAATAAATSTASQQPPSPSRTSANAQFAAGGSVSGSGSGPARRPPLAAHVAPGSAAPSLDPLPGLSLHWGCCHGLGQRWHAAASGWHTLPAVSYDAGRGAWQTPLAVRQAIPLDPDSYRVTAAGDGSSSGQWVAVYSLVLQLPWEGPIRNGGLCFVIKTARNKWIKARTLPNDAVGGSGGGSGSSSNGGGGGGGGEADFWIPTSALPVVANGVPLLPDVFRMSHSDSLPQVATVQQQTTPVSEPLTDNSDNCNGHSNGNSNDNGASVVATQTTAATTTTTTTTTTTAAQSQSQSPSPSAPSVGSEVDLLGLAAVFRPPPRLSDVLLRPAERHPLPPPTPAAVGGGPDGSGRPLGVCHWMLDHIVQREPSAERSLMHRYLAGAELVDMAGGSSEVAEALAAVTAWLRFSSARLLVWNRNYNVKPREISTAQARLAAAVAALGTTRGPAAPGGRGSAAVGALTRVALAAVGRGGAGEVGQRIRDEILAIQQRNGCKGGMMEEWHQKLHNNTSPDDVIICKALLDYIAAGLDVTVYWRTLTSAGITAQRLASFDRPITSEPRFSGQQAAGLQKDLTTYMQTLQAVHGGDDLSSAINNVLGYEETDMKGKHIVIPPVPKVATPTLERHLRALLALQRHLASPAAAVSAAAAAAAADAASTAQHHPSTGSPTSWGSGAPDLRSSAAQPTAPGASMAAAAAAPVTSTHRPTDVASLYGLPGAIRLMEMVVEARHQIRPFLDGGDSACGGRLVDVAFLDLALDSALRTAVETNIGPIKRTIADGTAIYIAAAARHGSGGSGGDSGRPLAGAFAAGGALTQALEVVRLTAENAALSSCPNDDLVYSNKWLRLLVAQEDPRDAKDRMLQGLAIAERLKRYLADQGAALMGLIQPATDALADRLKLPPEAVKGVGEEVVRGSSGAPLAQLLSCLEPALRQATGGGVWQIVSRGSDRPVLAGRLRVEARLAAVQHEVMREPTVLLVEGITGVEEIPEGCVAVLVGGGASGGGCPDVLSHSAVRARNMAVLLAGCHSPEMVARIKSHAGSRVMVRLEGADVQISFSSTGAASAAAAPS
ncbi:hypothetical protein Vafri_16667 [Volvox africanus]|uniref:Alpha-glucan water dikinase phosphohistidine-like domain-containing protein n=1 Tax=Volvox africanus TaxID=51714 RepID=A0A8J4F6Q1_9CHLO|nr:hypothetical protein Vafri_16667 [Volvox africanus]